MKISVVNGENLSEKFVIEIDKHSYVGDIKHKIDKILNGQGKWEKEHLRFIYKNIILHDEYIKRYKVCESDEIWFGKIENYLRSDDVIIEVFLAGCSPVLIWLIVKINHSITVIRSMIEIVQSKLINIYDWNGREMQNVQIVSDIDPIGYYRLIVSYEDERGKWLSFEDCVRQHDEFTFRFCLNSEFEFEDMTEINTVNLINKIRTIMSLNDVIDARLKENLSNIPSGVVNSKLLFYYNIQLRILDICQEFWKSTKDSPYYINYNIIKSFELSILVALHQYSHSRQKDPENKDKSFNGIVIDALDYLVKHLHDHCKDLKYHQKLFFDHFLLVPRPASEYIELRNKYSSQLITKIILNKKDNIAPFLTLLLTQGTVLDAKCEIAQKLGISIKDLYCINHWNHDKAEDDKIYKEGFYMFEIIKSMENMNLGKEFGAGGFGRVFFYQDIISGKQLAMKTANSDKSSLYRDIFISALIMYNSELFKYSGLFKYKSELYIAMPYMTGGSLTSYIQAKKGLFEKEALRISYQILIQIEKLHELKIIHRDIKPDNIVFDKAGNAKLIDFGLSKWMKNSTDENILEKLKAYAPGTINYMAPEILREIPYSYKIDIWSFGMVLVEMVTGNPPFHQKAPARAIIELKKMVEYKFKPSVLISIELHQFIKSCLTVNPNERPSAQQLIGSQFIIGYLQN